MKTTTTTLVSAFALVISAGRLAHAAPASPVYFEPNRGQSAAPLRFSSRGATQRLLVTDDAIWLRAAGQPLLRLELVGANKLLPIGQEPLAGVSHYPLGAEQSGAANIPHYAQLKLPEIYPGIDCVAYGAGSDLEYDFVVAPGADPNAIVMKFAGAQSVAVDVRGELRIRIDAGEVRQHPPHAYQDTEHGRQSVRARYRVTRGGQVTLVLGAYDKSLPLVIDPVITATWRRGVGGTDVITDIATDASGNVYATGYTDGSTFPTTSGAAQTTFRGDVDVFVSKMSPSGTVLYSTFFGGQKQDNAHAISLDSTGRAYVVGETTSTDLPIVRGFQTAVSGKKRAFVTVLASDGKSIAYSSYLGGSGASDKLSAWDIAVAPNGEFWLTGSTTVATFPFTINGFQRTLDPQNLEGNGDAFVLRGNPSLSGPGSVTYFSYYGAAGDDVGRKIGRSTAGNFVVAGDSDSQLLRVTKNLSTPAGRDVFLLLTSGATTFEGGVRLGGADDERAGGLGFDPSGNIYVAGETNSSNLPVSSDATQKTFADSSILYTDGFLAKVNAGGTSLLYLTYLGGSGVDRVNDVAVSGSGQASVVGTTFARNFPTTPSAIQTSTNGPRDGFLTRFSANGARAYSTYLGGGATDDALAVALSGATTWVASTSESSSFPGAPAALGDFDGILSKLSASALFVVGSTALTASDAAVRDRLQATLGFNVTVKAATDTSSADANGKDLVVVSSTVTAADVGTKFKTSAVGILNLEDGLQDDLGLTSTNSADFGRTAGQTQITMLTSTDPLSAGLSGNQTVTNAARSFNWGKPNANATRVASFLGDATRSTIYRYEVGSTLVAPTGTTLRAAERRVSFFMFEDVASALTGSGWSLFDAAARWAGGR